MAKFEGTVDDIQDVRKMLKELTEKAEDYQYPNVKVTKDIAETATKGLAKLYVGETAPQGTDIHINPNGETILIPEKTSELENDSDFATNKSVDDKIANIPSGDMPNDLLAENAKLYLQKDGAKIGKGADISMLSNIEIPNDFQNKTNASLNVPILYYGGGTIDDNNPNAFIFSTMLYCFDISQFPVVKSIISGNIPIPIGEQMDSFPNGIKPSFLFKFFDGTEDVYIDNKLFAELMSATSCEFEISSDVLGISFNVRFIFDSEEAKTTAMEVFNGEMLQDIKEEFSLIFIVDTPVIMTSEVLPQ